MSPETNRKPTLDAESFQRLLAAAFIMQSRGDWISRKPIRAADTKPFAARAIVQERTPLRPPSLARPGALGEVSTISKLSGLMFWKRVEALAIAVVFCLMMGISIHRLLAFPDHTSSPSATRESRDASPLARSTPTVLTSSQQLAATQKPRQWRSDAEDDAFDDDLVTHYQASAINLSGHAEKGPDTRTAQSQRLSRKDAALEAGVRIATSQVREILAETVVQYGDDVTMWSSGPSKKSALIREAR